MIIFRQSNYIGFFTGWSAETVDTRTLVPCVRRFVKQSKKYNVVQMTAEGHGIHEDGVAEKDEFLQQYN